MSKCRYDLFEDCNNKDCVRCVLDKIEAEIVEHAKINQNLNTDRAKALCWCLKVIDKYKIESGSEDKENDYLGRNKA